MNTFSSSACTVAYCFMVEKMWVLP